MYVLDNGNSNGSLGNNHTEHNMIKMEYRHCIITVFVHDGTKFPN